MDRQSEQVMEAKARNDAALEEVRRLFARYRSYREEPVVARSEPPAPTPSAPDKRTATPTKS